MGAGGMESVGWRHILMYMLPILSCTCCHPVVYVLLYHQVGWRDEERRVALKRTFKTEAAFLLARYLCADPRRHPDALLTAQGLLLEVYY